MRAISFLIILLSFISFSCTKDFEEKNTDPNRIDKISPGTLLNPVIYGLASFNTLRADDFTNDIMQVMMPFPSAVGGIHRYDITENSGSSTWNTYYRWLANLKEMRQASIEVGDPNYEAIAMTLNAWVYSQLTDCFGDVPMDEALQGDVNIFRPAYNTQKDIYTRILADLDSANNKFVTSRTMLFGTEILYNNNVTNWKRFCNSLRLRLLLRVSKRDEMGAFAKMAEILNNPTQYPVFTKNDEAAVLKITGTTPNISPWGRPIDFTTFRAAAAYFIDSLNAMTDPRLDKWNTKAKDLGGVTIGYKGIPAGYAGSESQFKYAPSNFNVALATAPMISLIMTYAEVEFIRAELILRGKLTGNAQQAYEKGVKAAMELWGVILPANYFANPAAAYNGQLERVLLQKYYALFFNDYQQWFEYRRTGLPVLPKNDGMLNNKIVPVRFPYPIAQRTGNTENYQRAVESMGGDDINTKGWWEK
jgi:hypothetical protein